MKTTGGKTKQWHVIVSWQFNFCLFHMLWTWDKDTRAHVWKYDFWSIKTKSAHTQTTPNTDFTLYREYLGEVGLFYHQSREHTGSEVWDHHLEAGTQVDCLSWDQVTEESHVLLHHSLAPAHPRNPLEKHMHEHAHRHREEFHSVWLSVTVTWCH